VRSLPFEPDLLRGARRQASKQAESVVRGGSRFCCETNELEPGSVVSCMLLVTEIEVAHVGVMDELDAGKVYPHIVGFPRRSIGSSTQSSLEKATSRFRAPVAVSAVAGEDGRSGRGRAMPRGSAG
jgi:hypothetical protein